MDSCQLQHLAPKRSSSHVYMYDLVLVGFEFAVLLGPRTLRLDTFLHLLSMKPIDQPACTRLIIAASNQSISYTVVERGIRRVKQL